MDVPTPAEEDPVIHRFLTALPRFQPAPAFETRVLTRVWRQDPLAWRRTRDALAHSWHLRAFLALLAAGAFVWQAILIGFVVENPNSVAESWQLFASEGVPALQSLASDALAQAATPIGELTNAIAVWWWLGVVALFVALFCAAGLYGILRSGRNSHVAH